MCCKWFVALQVYCVNVRALVAFGCTLELAHCVAVDAPNVLFVYVVVVFFFVGDMVIRQACFKSRFRWYHFPIGFVDEKSAALQILH